MVLKTWKTIKVGIEPKTVNNFCSASEKKGIKIDNLTKTLLNQLDFKAAEEEQEIDLLKLTAADLGFKGMTKRREIYRRLKFFGLETCPIEAFQLRLQYLNQPDGERILIGTEPITDPIDNSLKIFVVGCKDSRLWLGLEDGSPGHFFFPNSTWIFFRSRK